MNTIQTALHSYRHLLTHKHPEEAKQIACATAAIDELTALQSRATAAEQKLKEVEAERINDNGHNFVLLKSEMDESKSLRAQLQQAKENLASNVLSQQVRALRQKVDNAKEAESILRTYGWKTDESLQMFLHRTISQLQQATAEGEELRKQNESLSRELQDARIAGYKSVLPSARSPKESTP